MFWIVLLFLLVSFAIDIQDTYLQFAAYLYLIGLIIAIFGFPLIGVISFTGAEYFSQTLLRELSAIQINITTLGFLIISVLFIFFVLTKRIDLQKRFNPNHVFAICLVIIAVIVIHIVVLNASVQIVLNILVIVPLVVANYI